MENCGIEASLDMSGIGAGVAYADDDGSNNDKRNFICVMGCGRSYRSYHTMTRHMKYECGTEKMFQCTICKKRFSHKHHLKNHCGNSKKCSGGMGVIQDD